MFGKHIFKWDKTTLECLEITKHRLGDFSSIAKNVELTDSVLKEIIQSQFNEIPNAIENMESIKLLNFGTIGVPKRRYKRFQKRLEELNTHKDIEI